MALDEAFIPKTKQQEVGGLCSHLSQLSPWQKAFLTVAGVFTLTALVLHGVGIHQSSEGHSSKASDFHWAAVGSWSVVGLSVVASVCRCAMALKQASPASPASPVVSADSP